MAMPSKPAGRFVAVLLTLAVGLGLVAGLRAAEEPNDAIQRALIRLESLGRDPMVVALPPAAPTEVEMRNRLLIARSIRIIEASLDTSLAVLTGDVLPLLSLARNYRHLGLRGRSMQWYERASIADKERDFSESILQERIDIAIELGDSARIVELAGDVLDRKDHAAWTPTLGTILHALADRPVIGRGHLRLAARIEAISGRIDADCMIELARLYQRRDEDSSALAIYRELLARESTLQARQMALTLMGLADATLASGNVRKGSGLLRRYRAHDTGQLSAWATFQLGGLAAGAGRYDEAVALFRSICEREANTPWRDDACTRLAQVKELEAVDEALRPYGRSLRVGKETR